MFERRPIWGLILGLNVCVLIWRISVQEPALLEAETFGVSGVSSSGSIALPSAAQQQQEIEASSALAYKHRLAKEKAPQKPPIIEFIELEKQQQQQKQELYAGKHLLSERGLQTNDSSSNSNSIAIATEKSPILSKKYKYKVAHRKGFAEDSGVAVAERSAESQLQNSSRISSENISISNRSSRFSISRKSRYHNNINKSALIAKQKNYTTTTTSPPPLVMAATLPQSINATTAPPPTLAPAIAADLPHLIDLHDFTYLMTQPDCHAHIVALILVHSAPHNYEKRALIRETWGSAASSSRASPLRLLFLLGAVLDPALQHKLARENARYADMVQGSFIDDYRNMTYKHAMAFKWTLHQCASAQILVKVDDDVYVNTPQLLRYLDDAADNNTSFSSPVHAAQQAPPSPSSTLFASSPPTVHSAAGALFLRPHELLFCSELRGSMVKRSFRSKWRVSVHEYAHRYYPPYCPGFAIIYSTDVVRRLYAEAQQNTYFWIDDVHITGILAQRTNTSITTLLPYVLYADRLEQLLARKLSLQAVEFLVAWHRITPEQMRALWRLEVEQSESLRVEEAAASTSSAALVAVTASVDNDGDYNGRASSVHRNAYASYPYEEGFR